MQLSDYPDYINRAAKACLMQKFRVQEAEAELMACEMQVERAVAYDTDLKNDLQRRVKRLELQQTDWYARAALTLQEAKNTLLELQIEHDCLVHRFQVAKIEARTRVAALDLDWVFESTRSAV